MLRLMSCLPVLGLALTISASDLVEENGFRVPEGFGVQLYAGDALAHDISCLTFDPQGRVVVSGPGYIKTLIPDDDASWQAPKAKSAVAFSRTPASGAQGLCFAGTELFASGDGAVWRFHDADGDGVADGPPEKFVEGLKIGGEHGVHGIVQGPDGWLYVIGGDGSGLTEKLNTIPAATIREVTGGAILRVSPDGTQREIIAHGFRNPYAMCFNHLGSIFVWDSDGERVEHLPGYRPCSLFDVGRGRHHGWVNTVAGNPFSRPWHWPDVVDPVVEVGRGSPTGMVCYRHRQFPEEWQGGVFFACWTFGRIYFCKPQRMTEQQQPSRSNSFEPPPPTPTGPGYTAEKQVFLEPVGNQGFAPTALAIGPDGALYVASGGRGTKGAVYRIAHKTNEIHGDAEDEVEQVLAADQPEAAWSRRQWVEQAKALGAKPFEDWLLRNTVGLSPLEDIRALEVLTELFGGVSAEIGSHISSRMSDEEHKQAGRELLARLAWAAERNPKLNDTQRNDSFQGPATEAGSQGHRAALESVMMQKGGLQRNAKQDDVLPAAYAEEIRRAINFGDKDGAPLSSMRELIVAAGDVQLHHSPQWDDGYVVAAPEKIRKEALGHGDWFAKAPREYARLVAMTQTEPPAFWDSLPGLWTAESSVADDVHYLFVAARRSRAHEKTKPIADAWLRLHHKLRERGQSPSRAWPQMAGDAFAAMLKQTPALAEAIISSPLLTLPGHVLFVEKLGGDTKQQGILRLAAAAEEWTPELVKLAGEGIEAAGTGTQKSALLGEVRGHAENPALRDAATLVLLRHEAPDKRKAWALRGLESFTPSVVLACAATLADKEGSPGPVVTGALIKAARRFENRADARETLDELLKALLPDSSARDIATAEKAFAAKFPEMSGQLARSTPGFDPGQERLRWTRLDPSKGDASRGRTIYEQRQCARCHSGNARLGPDLKGATQRWSVEDLFLQIADPSRQISPAWKGERFVLKDGREFTGVAVYDSPASLLVQISPDETVRITGGQLRLRAASGISLMPPGLLQGLSDADLADLHKWLQTVQ